MRLVPFIVAALVLAGCTAPADDITVEPATLHGFTDDPASDTMLGTFEVDGRTVASFIFDSTSDELTVEPFMDGELTQYAVLAFDLEDQAHLAYAFLNIQADIVAKITPAIQQRTHVDMQPGSFELDVNQGLLGIVVLAEGHGTLAMAMGNDGIDEQSAQFLTPHHTAQGFSLPLYVDFNFGGARSGPGILGIEAWNADMVVDRNPTVVDTRPAATVDRVVLHHEPGLDEGWFYGIGGYAGGNGVADYDFDIQPFGASHQDAGMWIGDGVGATALLGFPFYFMSGEGTGPSKSTMQLDIKNTNAYEILMMLHLEVGATIDDLLGAPGASFLDSSRPVLTTADGLTIDGGAPIRIPGILAPDS